VESNPNSRSRSPGHAIRGFAFHNKFFLEPNFLEFCKKGLAVQGRIGKVPPRSMPLFTISLKSRAYLTTIFFFNYGVKKDILVLFSSASKFNAERKASPTSEQTSRIWICDEQSQFGHNATPTHTASVQVQCTPLNSINLGQH